MIFELFIVTKCNACITVVQVRIVKVRIRFLKEDCHYARCGRTSGRAVNCCSVMLCCGLIFEVRFIDTAGPKAIGIRIISLLRRIDCTGGNIAVNDISVFIKQFPMIKFVSVVRNRLDLVGCSAGRCADAFFVPVLIVGAAGMSVASGTYFQCGFQLCIGTAQSQHIIIVIIVNIAVTSAGKCSSPGAGPSAEGISVNIRSGLHRKRVSGIVFPVVDRRCISFRSVRCSIYDADSSVTVIGLVIRSGLLRRVVSRCIGCISCGRGQCGCPSGECILISIVAGLGGRCAGINRCSVFFDGCCRQRSSVRVLPCNGVILILRSDGQQSEVQVNLSVSVHPVYLRLLNNASDVCFGFTAKCVPEIIQLELLPHCGRYRIGKRLIPAGQRRHFQLVQVFVVIGIPVDPVCFAAGFLDQELLGFKAFAVLEIIHFLIVLSAFHVLEDLEGGSAHRPVLIDDQIIMNRNIAAQRLVIERERPSSAVRPLFPGLGRIVVGLTLIRCASAIPARLAVDALLRFQDEILAAVGIIPLNDVLNVKIHVLRGGRI